MTAEQAVVANALGLKVSQRGMIGRDYRGHVDGLVACYDVDALKALGGIVDYVVGATPSPGIYVLAAARDDNQAFFLDLGKLGKGPRSEEHTSELQSLMRISYAVFCLKKKNKTQQVQ